MRTIVILLTFLISFQCFSQPNIDTQRLISACEKIYSELDNILNKVNQDPDVDIFCPTVIVRAQTYLRFSTLKIEQGNYPIAVINLLTVEKILRNMVINQDSCPDFGSLVKPLIPIVIAIKNEIDEDLSSS